MLFSTSNNFLLKFFFSFFAAIFIRFINLSVIIPPGEITLAEILNLAFSIAIALLSLLGLALFAKPKVVMNTVPAMLPHIIVMGIVYLQNRLLYGMCVN